MIWRFRSPLMREQVAACARDVNAVLAVGLQMGQYLDLVPTGVPTALDNYNVESRILARLGETRTGAKRLYWLGEARKLARHEKRVLEQFGVVFAISETDREALQSLAPRARVMTLPMGIDLDVFGAPSTVEPEPQPCFTFVGAFNWHVNEDAAVWLCGQVWPRVLASLPNAQLHLVGREPSATVRALAADPTVHISGTVDDVRPYMHRSWAMLVPLRYGSGVRTKILEAFAAGRPVITTTIGCEGLPVHHGEHLHIADDAAAFANACINVAHDPSAARVLADRARQLVTRLEQEGAARIHTTLEEAFGAGLRPRRGV